MKFLKPALVCSLIVNFLLAGVILRPTLSKFTSHEQPDVVTYQKGRNEVLSKLPIDSNEVIMLGNSLTQWFEWHEIFKEVNIKNRGIGSDITKGVLYRMEDILKNKPLKIFIEIGVNDLILGYPVDSILNNYMRIIQKVRLQSPNTTVYVQSILPTTNKIRNTLTLNQMLRDYCASNNIMYIDLYSHFAINNSLNPKYDCGDGIHLNADGYLLWCKVIDKHVKNP